jgi:hypothetical protein
LAPNFPPNALMAGFVVITRTVREAFAPWNA